MPPIFLGNFVNKLVVWRMIPIIYDIIVVAFLRLSLLLNAGTWTFLLLRLSNYWRNPRLQHIWVINFDQRFHPRDYTFFQLLLNWNLSCSVLIFPLFFAFDFTTDRLRGLCFFELFLAFNFFTAVFIGDNEFFELLI